MTDIAKSIDALRKEWGSRVLIIGHHYQRPEVLQHVDFRGDSLELARKAAESSAERILFCGVRFMAESADILTDPSQAVYLAEATAGCPMADMADAASAERGLERLRRVADNWTPVVYVNSSAEVKAFCGRNGGSACTSSNSERVLKHYCQNNRRIFFLPDEHLGKNTANDLGIADAEVCIYDPAMPDGGCSDEQLDRARVVVWKGYCHVHTNFTLQQIQKVRRDIPDARIIVHPESPQEVVRASDAHGSTAYIIRYVEEAPRGSTIVIGTELQLVRFLKEKYKGRLNIKALLSSSCPNMFRTDEAAVYNTLSRWPPAGRVSVPEHIADDARICLERMLQL